MLFKVSTRTNSKCCSLIAIELPQGSPISNPAADHFQLAGEAGPETGHPAAGWQHLRTIPSAISLALKGFVYLHSHRSSWHILVVVSIYLSVTRSLFFSLFLILSLLPHPKDSCPFLYFFVCLHSLTDGCLQSHEYRSKAWARMLALWGQSWEHCSGPPTWV